MVARALAAFVEVLGLDPAGHRSRSAAEGIAKPSRDRRILGHCNLDRIGRAVDVTVPAHKGEPRRGHSPQRHYCAGFVARQVG